MNHDDEVIKKLQDRRKELKAGLKEGRITREQYDEVKEALKKKEEVLFTIFFIFNI